VKNTKIGKLRIAIEALALIVSIALPVYAYTYFSKQAMSSGIVILTPTVSIRVYWDELATLPVTSIDFGQVNQPNRTSILQQILYIKNEGTVNTPIYWNSTLGEVTAQLTDTWFTNGTEISADTVLWTAYEVSIPAYVTVGTYNWTLTVWGEY